MEAESYTKTLQHKEKQKIKILIFSEENNSLLKLVLANADLEEVDAIGNRISEINVAVFLAKFTTQNLKAFKFFKKGRNVLAVYVCDCKNGFAILAVLESSTQPEEFFEEEFNEKNLEDYIKGYLKFWNLAVNPNDIEGTDKKLMEVGKICSEIINAYMEGKPFKIFPDFYWI